MATAPTVSAGRRLRRARARAAVEEPLAGGTATLKIAGIESDPEWRELYAAMLKESTCLFARDVLGIETPPYMLEWGDLAATSPRLAILAARDHGKSTFFTYAYPIHRAVMEPGVEVYLFARTLEQSMEYLDIILYGKNNLKGMCDIPDLAKLVPEGRTNSQTAGRTKKTKTDLRLKNGSRIRCVSYGKAVRGAHPKYVICDDVLNDEDMFSETVRKKNLAYFQGAISQMPPNIDPLHGGSGQIIVVGTPYHIADLYGFLKKNPEYTFRKYAAIQKGEDGVERPLFPWRWPLAALLKKRREIGPIAFAREVLCEPITDDLSVFPSHLFPPLYDETITLRPSKQLIAQRQLNVYMGVDLALSANVGADYTVIFVMGRDPEGNHYILDIQRYKGYGFKKQLELVERAARRYGPNLIFIEGNQFQRVFSDEMQRTTDLPVKAFTVTAQNKYPLDRGVPGLRILLENDKVIIPRGDAYSITQTDTWIGEAGQFGFVDGKLQGIGEHDDTVMAWWMCEEAMKAGGFSFAMGEDEKTGEDGSTADDRMTAEEEREYQIEMGLIEEPETEQDTPEDDAELDLASNFDMFNDDQ